MSHDATGTDSGTDSQTAPAVRHEPEAGRYAAYLDGQEAGFMTYRLEGDDLIVLDHTVVPEAFGGRGIASALAEVVLADVRAGAGAVAGEQRRLVPQCSFVAGYLRKHPELADLAAG